MKLSMWMIANRLSSFDLEVHIDDKAPAVLNSARLAYATNCVHVYEEKNYVVCNGEGNIIKLFNMTETQAFEIVQSVFDYFQDWMDQVISAIGKKDYQAVVDLACQVFRNPVVLFDGNNKVLGITRQYGPDALDDEWNYLLRYGHSSLNSVQMMKYHYGNIDFGRHGSQAFKFSDNRRMKYSGISYCMYCNEITCGRINLFAKDRLLNEGDYQLLEQLASLLEPSLGQIYYESVLNNSNVFYNILFGKPYDIRKLEIQLNYQQWNADDIYHLALVKLTGDFDQADLKYSLDSLMQTVRQNASSCITLKKSPYVLILANHTICTDKSLMSLLEGLTANNPIHIGFSLPCRGLKYAAHLYQQAKSAIYYGTLSSKASSFYHFFDYAIDFIIDSPSLQQSIHACLPGIVQLWEMQRSSGDDLLNTLKCYLDHERSASKTSTALHTHRNTVLYRIQKIQDLLELDLDDVYVRDYCRLSIRTLELYEHKKP